LLEESDDGDERGWIGGVDDGVVGEGGEEVSSEGGGESCGGEMFC